MTTHAQLSIRTIKRELLELNHQIKTRELVIRTMLFLLALVLLTSCDLSSKYDKNGFSQLSAKDQNKVDRIFDKRIAELLQQRKVNAGMIKQNDQRLLTQIHTAIAEDLNAKGRANENQMGKGIDLFWDPTMQPTASTYSSDFYNEICKLAPTLCPNGAGPFSKSAYFPKYKFDSLATRIVQYERSQQGQGLYTDIDEFGYRIYFGYYQNDPINSRGRTIQGYADRFSVVVRMTYKGNDIPHNDTHYNVAINLGDLCPPNCPNPPNNGAQPQQPVLPNGNYPQ